MDNPLVSCSSKRHRLQVIASPFFATLILPTTWLSQKQILQRRHVQFPSRLQEMQWYVSPSMYLHQDKHTLFVELQCVRVVCERQRPRYALAAGLVLHLVVRAQPLCTGGALEESAALHPYVTIALCALHSVAAWVLRLSKQALAAMLGNADTIVTDPCLAKVTNGTHHVHAHNSLLGAILVEAWRRKCDALQFVPLCS